jgi:hypothetical protein
MGFDTKKGKRGKGGCVLAQPHLFFSDISQYLRGLRDVRNRKASLIAFKSTVIEKECSAPYLEDRGNPGPAHIEEPGIDPGLYRTGNPDPGLPLNFLCRGKDSFQDFHLGEDHLEDPGLVANQKGRDPDEVPLIVGRPPPTDLCMAASGVTDCRGLCIKILMQ